MHRSITDKYKSQIADDLQRLKENNPVSIAISRVLLFQLSFSYKFNVIYKYIRIQGINIHT